MDEKETEEQTDEPGDDNEDVKEEQEAEPDRTIADVFMTFVGVGGEEELAEVCQGAIEDAEKRGLIYTGGSIQPKDMDQLVPRPGSELEQLVTGIAPPDGKPE